MGTLQNIYYRYSKSGAGDLTVSEREASFLNWGVLSVLEKADAEIFDDIFTGLITFSLSSEFGLFKFVLPGRGNCYISFFSGV